MSLLKPVSLECPTPENLAAFLENALTPKERQEVERHLVTCRTCREVLKAALNAEDPSATEC